MTDNDLLAYVKAGAALQGIPLTHQRAMAVAAHLRVAQGIAQTFQSDELFPDDEPAQLYCPAPFPSKLKMEPQP
jgi:hypothetical protein